MASSRELRRRVTLTEDLNNSIPTHRSPFAPLAPAEFNYMQRTKRAAEMTMGRGSVIFDGSNG